MRDLLLKRVVFVSLMSIALTSCGLNGASEDGSISTSSSESSPVPTVTVTQTVDSTSEKVVLRSLFTPSEIVAKLQENGIECSDVTVRATDDESLRFTCDNSGGFMEFSVYLDEFLKEKRFAKYCGRNGPWRIDYGNQDLLVHGENWIMGTHHNVLPTVDEITRALNGESEDYQRACGY